MSDHEFGVDVALAHLEGQKMLLIERCDDGPLFDLVMGDGSEYVFVLVTTRQRPGVRHPLQGVALSELEQIEQAGQEWVEGHIPDAPRIRVPSWLEGEPGIPPKVRVDLVEVVTEPPKIRHLKGATSWISPN